MLQSRLLDEGMVVGDAVRIKQAITCKEQRSNSLETIVVCPSSINDILLHLLHSQLMILAPHQCFFYFFVGVHFFDPIFFAPFGADFDLKNGVSEPDLAVFSSF